MPSLLLRQACLVSRTLSAPLNSRLPACWSGATRFSSWSAGLSKFQETRKKGGGVGDAIKSGVTEHSKEKQNSVFRQQLEELAGTKSFDLSNYASYLDDMLTQSGVGTVKRQLPWVKNKEEFKDIEMQKAIIAAMTDFHKANPGKIKGDVRMQIAQRSGFPAPEVSRTLKKFGTTEALHEWVRRHVDQGKTLPATPDELQTLMASSPSRKLVKMQKGQISKGAARNAMKKNQLF